MKTQVTRQPGSIANRPLRVTPGLIPVPEDVKRGFQSLPCFLLLVLLLVTAGARQGFAGCDGFGGDGGDCQGGGGGSLLVFTTNAVSATVTRVDGLIFSGVVIPSSYFGLPVTRIEPSAFADNFLANVTIPDSVTNIGAGAFFNCSSLTNIDIGDGVTSIGQGAFDSCWSLASFQVGALNPAFSSLAGVLFNRNRTALLQFPMGKIGAYTIPASVTTIGDAAFAFCGSLSRIYFHGNPPALGVGVFESTMATVYYLPGTPGWGARFGDRPTARWSLPYPVILNGGPGPGAQPGAFGFIISWASNNPVVVEACTDLAAPAWSAVGTNTLVGGWSYFSDPLWKDHPVRFYRLRPS